jgi:hypothetical protein
MRGSFFAKRRRLMQSWADYLSSGNVVDLSARLAA